MCFTLGQVRLGYFRYWIPQQGLGTTGIGPARLRPSAGVMPRVINYLSLFRFIFKKREPLLGKHLMLKKRHIKNNSLAMTLLTNKLLFVCSCLLSVLPKTKHT